MEDSDTETAASVSQRGDSASMSSVPASTTTEVSPASSEVSLDRRKGPASIVDRRKVYLLEAGGHTASPLPSSGPDGAGK